MTYLPGAGASLQGAYNAGAAINLSAANPIIVTAAAAIDEMLRLVEGGVGWHFYKGTVLGPDGSAANPAVSFLTDAALGVYRTAGGALGHSAVRTSTIADETAFEFSATINKASGTNDYTAVLVNATETAAPGSDNRLLDLQVGGQTQAYISSRGALSAEPPTAFTGSTTLAAPYGLGITATLSLTGTAESTALGIFITETTHTTTGDTRLIHAQVGGSDVMELLDTGQLILPTDGGSTAPVIRFGSTGVTGFYSDASSRLNVTINNVERFRFVSAQLLSDDNGSASATTYSWVGDDNTGPFRNAADEYGFSAGGSAVILDGTGTVNLSPDTNDSYELGTASLKWANIHATNTNFGDVHLARDGFHYTIVEGEDGLYLHDRNTDKAYRFVLEEVDVLDAPEPRPHPELI